MLSKEAGWLGCGGWRLWQNYLMPCWQARWEKVRVGAKTFFMFSSLKPWLVSFGPNVFSLHVNWHWQLSWLVHGWRGLNFHHQLLCEQKWCTGATINISSWKGRVPASCSILGVFVFQIKIYLCVRFAYFTLGLYINTSWGWLIILDYYQLDQKRKVWC